MTTRLHRSHLDELEAEAVHIMREVAAELERPVLLFSGGKDSIVLLRLAEKAFRPGRFPFPLMHVDTGHNFPRRSSTATVASPSSASASSSPPCRSRSTAAASSRRPGRAPRATGCRRRRCSTRSSEHEFDAAIGGARRDEERSRAKERIFSFRDDFGQWDPRASAPSCGRSTTARSARASTCGSSRSRTGPSSTSGSTSRTRSSSCRRSTSPTSARCSSATGCSTRTSDVIERDDDEVPFTEWVRFRTVGDMSCTGAVRSHAVYVRRGRGRDRRHARHRARRDARRRSRHRGGDGGPEACRLLLMPELVTVTADGAAELLRAGHVRLRRRRQVDADRPPALRHEAGVRRPDGGTSRRRASAAATATSTSRCSPTACAPSASRGSRSMSPIAASSLRGAASSSQTLPGTCSTRATW